MTLRVGPIQSPSDASVVPGWNDYEFLQIERNFLNEGIVQGVGDAFAVTEHSGPNMTVNVGTGRALIEITNTNVTHGKTYKVWFDNDASVSKSITTADGTNPRKDRVVLRVDVATDPDGNSSNVAIIEVLAGTPAGSPSAPAEPSNAITLAIIDIPAGDTTISTGQITDSRTYIQLPTSVLLDITRVADLASTANGKGASLIAVEDSGGQYTGTNVETVLAEIDARLDTLATLSQIGFYGDGADGVPSWTSGASLNPATEKRYTTATLPVSQTLSVSSVNTPLVLHNTSDVTINGTVDLNGKGGAGAAGVSGADTVGNDGTPGNSLISGFTTAGGSGGGIQSGTARGGGGGGGSSGVSNGSVGQTDNSAAGGAGGVMITAQKLAFLSTLLRGLVCGAGGASGGRSNAGTSGVGGAGGGALLWMIGGNLTLGASSVIRADGAAGGNASGGGDGGGGGGGMIVILVAGSITNSGATLTAAGGAGATGGTSGEGGQGAAGKVVIYSLSTGTLIVS